VDAVRQKLYEILEGSDKWDKQARGLQVTNTTECSIELRALMSASDSSKMWDLRCEVREELMTFFQKNFPESLPKIRLILNAAIEKEQDIGLLKRSPVLK
jgi:hypothetical protein